MKEDLISASHWSVASTDCTKPKDPSKVKKAIMGRNWKSRLGLPLKTNSGNSMSNLRKIKSHRPTADDVIQWAQSLDKLLSHKYGKMVFFIFLKTEYCEENIEFWNACEDFRMLSSHQELTSKAISIYEEFIKSEAPKEVNLDFYTKNKIIQSLNELNVASFLTAQGKVYSLMENNSYPRFIHSDLYKELLADARRGR
ncbi:regulator of G-protein signaling 2-like [Corythoichthys intestinalis]|uniref:regulator of G-protein signaling 2-like n=1 Tax=Corythoichthys intestinalis TaxID=161448 RepID=UPI0025A63587|nr:regulator of G-protein signaling 2-like [Corythoichthys intestinalis]XP_061791180.1 regulator of G-protein signaling 2-like [Nerophis lumbriciformis]